MLFAVLFASAVELIETPEPPLWVIRPAIVVMEETLLVDGVIRYAVDECVVDVPYWRCIRKIIGGGDYPFHRYYVGPSTIDLFE